MKLIKSVLLVLTSCLLLCGCTININVPDSTQVNKEASPTNEYVFPNNPPAPPPPPPATNPSVQTQWSEWSSYYPYFANEIESRKVLAGYNMIVYVTQEAQKPHVRMFRNFSIAGALEACGARDTYGEKLLTRYASIDELNSAKAYSPGTTILSKYCGKQCGTATAYCFRDNDKEYTYFIESEVYIDQFRYR